MDFQLLSGITHITNIAVGSNIHDLEYYEKAYGKGRWRKVKGIATVKPNEGNKIYIAEIHWYEADGIGKFDFKIKDYIEEVDK